MGFTCKFCEMYVTLGINISLVQILRSLCFYYTLFNKVIIVSSWNLQNKCIYNAYHMYKLFFKQT